MTSPLPSQPTGAVPPPPENRLPRSFYCDERGAVSRDLPFKELTAAHAGGGRLWVHVDSSVRQQVALLEKIFDFHPLAIEDVLHPNSRAKVEEFDGYLFVVLRAVRFDENTADPYDLETTNLYFFIGANFLVTVHAGPSPHVESVAQVLQRSQDVMLRGPARLAHQIMDSAVDGFFPILDHVEEFIDGLEERVFQQFDEESLRDIFAVKRMVLSLRRYLAPEREIFNILTNRPLHLLPPDVQVYFRDVYDHILRINDSLDTYRDLLGSTMESYLSQVSNRLGRVSKGLTVIATLSVPFVVVSGMWGMNFARIPLAAHPWGFEIILVAQLALGLALIWLLTRRGMI